MNLFKTLCVVGFMAFLAFAVLTQSGCAGMYGPGMQGVKHHTAKPKVWYKSGLSHEQMVFDSLQCQDAATARDSSMDTYTTTTGFTTRQVEFYDACMAAKGYRNPTRKEIAAHKKKMEEEAKRAAELEKARNHPLK